MFVSLTSFWVSEAKIIVYFVQGFLTIMAWQHRHFHYWHQRTCFTNKYFHKHIRNHELIQNKKYFKWKPAKFDHVDLKCTLDSYLPLLSHKYFNSLLSPPNLNILLGIFAFWVLNSFNFISHISVLVVGR